ncbi:hypothetical protein AB0K89_09045, partial [Streptomyces cinnamoneus]
AATAAGKAYDASDHVLASFDPDVAAGRRLLRPGLPVRRVLGGRLSGRGRRAVGLRAPGRGGGRPGTPGAGGVGVGGEVTAVVGHRVLQSWSG